MMKAINIGGIKVPLLDYAVSCSAILGIRDSGKTVTAKGIAEQLLEHNIPIVVFDAVGKWRWMKTPGQESGARGYQVVVAGGREPDLPLTPQSVPEIVRSSIREKIPLIIDLYDAKLSKADWRRIVQQSIRIIHYESDGIAHVFLEEAAEFIPQRVVDGETYAEVEKLARMGGNASVGITLINQRSQEVNKAVLDLAHNLVLGCQIGNKAIEAVEKWVDRLAPDVAKAVTSSLPKMKSGEAWVWTRSNPDDPKRVQMPMCRSLHPDRRTPEVALKTMKAIDTHDFVQRLSKSIPKVIEEAKANDPALLKAEIRRLKAEKPVDQSVQVKEVQKPVFDDKDRKLITKAISGFEDLDKAIKERMEGMRDIYRELNTLRGSIEVLIGRQRPVNVRQTPKPRIIVSDLRGPVIVDDESRLGGPEIKLLSALKQFPEGVTKQKLALLTCYSHNGVAFNNPLGALRGKGLAEGYGGNIRITEAGMNHPQMENIEPLPTGQDLIDYWLSKLSGPQATILKSVLESERPLTKEELAERCGYEPSGGAFNNPLGSLRTLGILKRGWPAVANPDLLA